MEASSSTDLPESIFFTARKARIRTSNIQNSSSSSEPASSSREYFSARIHSIMELKSELSMSREDAAIEASKDHWTEVEPNSFTTSLSTSGSVSQSCSEALTESERLALYEENLKDVQRLQEANPESKFFRIGNDGLVLGKKIGEGGHAEIYDAGAVLWNKDDGDNEEYPMVLKVFKAGFSVGALQSQWPLGFLHRSVAPSNITPRGYNSILHGRLLEDGRFAFQMHRLWGDLRKWLEERMERNGNRHPPFMLSDGNYYECCMLRIMRDIAKGLKDLHEQGTLHRDLKASNVLILTWDNMKESGIDPKVVELDIICFVTDYECSIGVVGTGYWRAPEILHALKIGSAYTTTDLFTPKSDVYSFAMTCYEVLTGCVPFEEVLRDYDKRALDADVLQGRRPSYLQPWMVDLMDKCWHTDPLKRLTFEEIYDLLKNVDDNAQRCHSQSIFFARHHISNGSLWTNSF